MICGIDEAGRGPLAGPVTAAAVILDTEFDAASLKDSKKLSEKKRDEIRRKIYASSSIWGIGWASNQEIDEFNILQATFLAMQRAYEELYKKVCKILKNNPIIDVIVDGNMTPNISNCNTVTSIVKADDSIDEVKAASILAKTARDKMMIRYSWLYPEYQYNTHKGYGTKKHIEAIRLFGTSPIQRKSFAVKLN